MSLGKLVKIPNLIKLLNLTKFSVLRQPAEGKPPLRLSREQRLLADFAEAEQGRVAKGKPPAIFCYKQNNHYLCAL